MSESDKKRFCVNFTGIQSLRCMAEVRYLDVCQRNPWRYPCMDGVTAMSGPELPCESRRWPGDES